MRQSSARKFIVLVMVVFGIWPIWHIAAYNYNIIVFKQQCGDYLKLAADASTIELATERLGKAVSYLETNNITTGNTSIFFATPQNDVGEWYKNLKSAHNNLKTLPPNLTETDKTNTLIKLRETIIDHNVSGDTISAPNHIAQCPSCRLMMWGWVLTFTLIATEIVLLIQFVYYPYNVWRIT